MEGGSRWRLDELEVSPGNCSALGSTRRWWLGALLQGRAGPSMLVWLHLSERWRRKGAADDRGSEDSEEIDRY